jgi:hypothetical protein
MNIWTAINVLRFASHLDQFGLSTHPIDHHPTPALWFESKRREWQRVAESGREWQRVAESGREWQIVAESGREWQRQDRISIDLDQLLHLERTHRSGDYMNRLLITSL